MLKIAKEKDLTGLYLYSGCAGRDFGQIIKDYKDENGADVIDIEVYDVDKLMSFECKANDEDSKFESYLTTAYLPEGVNVIVKKAGYILTNLNGTTFIEINNAANQCYRCVKSFILESKKSED